VVYFYRESKLIVGVKKLDEKAQIPKYQTDGSAGFDFHALEDFTISPGGKMLVRTGLAFEIPKGYEIQVRPRSGLSSKTGLKVALGTIDSDYRGEVRIILEYIGSGPTIAVDCGHRIAQGVLAPAPQAIFREANDLSITDRGIKGFGSSAGDNIRSTNKS